MAISSSTARPKSPSSTCPSETRSPNGIRYIGLLLAADQAQCRMEAGGISDREKLLGFGAVAAAAHTLGNGEVEGEPAIELRP
ncbi:hypothetical protein ACVWWN_007168 [Mycobacterium sp. URHB0021]|jgi:hypothetical protein